MARIDVQVPEAAIIYINDVRMSSTGKTRHYGWTIPSDRQVVTCTVRAIVASRGEKIEKIKKVTVRAGDSVDLKFDDLMDLKTTLSLGVPSDAVVYLGNKRKRGSGPVRVFSTNRLRAGKSVSDYPVRVSVMRNGRQISQEQRITLGFGEHKKLSFDFQAGVAELALR